MIRFVFILSGFLSLHAVVGVVEAAVVAVEPAELIKRDDLIGREISVDDRVAFFQVHPGRGFDEIHFKRTPVVFRLPPKLRYAQAPSAPAARVQGLLKRDGNTFVCDVTGVELFPRDLDRLNRGVEGLPPGEFERRSSWALWAERRGNEFKDNELLQRAHAIDAEAFRSEAERVTSDPAKHWLALAERARSRQIPEPEPSALAHRAFRRRLEDARTGAEFEALAMDIARFFPESAKPVGSDPNGLSSWEASYAKEPGAAYRSAPKPVQVSLNRRLWADAMEKSFERRTGDDPKQALALADQAVPLLPDRPKLIGRLLEQGLEVASRGLGSLRLGEVQTLAKAYRERLNQPDRAVSLLRDWLKEKRIRHLSPTDAEGRVALAVQYETLVSDRETAVALLREAWKIDPQSSEVSDALRRRGFRKVNEEWMENPRNSASADTTPTPSPGESERSKRQPLKGKTSREVRNLLGKPNRVIFSASQGQLIEQWIYLAPTQDQYVNFLHGTTDLLPTVLTHYSLSHRASTSLRP
ncbi:tetratricopeptide repeat protein [Singulisphaera rosea]